MSYTRTTDPTVEPVYLQDAKEHLNVLHNDDDSVIAFMISAAREHAEHYTGRSLNTQTWTINLERFPSHKIEISKGRLISVTSIKYYDIDNVQQTLVEDTDFFVDKFSEPAIIIPSTTGWPSTWTDGLNAVEIIVKQGYGDGTGTPYKVPQAIKQAILLHVGHMYEHRESVSDFSTSPVPMGYNSLIQPYRLIGY